MVEKLASLSLTNLVDIPVDTACQLHAPSKFETSVALCCDTKLHIFVLFCPQHKVHLCNDYAV